MPSGIRLTQEEYIKRVSKIHNNKYDYSKVEYKTLHKKIIITCVRHGDFVQSANNHMNGNGCPICAKESITNGLAIFIEKAQAVHGTRYGYCCVTYVNNNTKVAVVCKKHGIFYIIPRAHTSGTGCPKCRTSKGENKIAEYLTRTGIVFEAQKKFNECANKKKLRYDFFLNDFNILIEFDGLHHEKLVTFCYSLSQESMEKRLAYTQKLDQIKNEYAAKNNIRLIRIPYTEINNIEEILSNAIYQGV